MAASTFNLNAPRGLLYDAIMNEIRSWADLPRRVFTQAHYAGKSVEEIAAQSGYGAREVSQILETHERKLRKSLRTFRIR
jgi:DNA-directed RNA polymerase specialized sigma24 family protein